MPQPPVSATQLLEHWRGGDADALQALIPVVYKELRRAAHRCLLAERPDHTLQSTELVHEVYLRLAGDRPGTIINRAHFVAIAGAIDATNPRRLCPPPRSRKTRAAIQG